MPNILLSSTGSGIKLRILSLLPLLIPLASQAGLSIDSGCAQSVINDLAYLLAGISHAWGWIRAYKNKQG